MPVDGNRVVLALGGTNPPRPLELRHHMRQRQDDLSGIYRNVLGACHADVTDKQLWRSSDACAPMGHMLFHLSDKPCAHAHGPRSGEQAADQVDRWLTCLTPRQRQSLWSDRPLKLSTPAFHMHAVSPS